MVAGRRERRPRGVLMGVVAVPTWESVGPDVLKPLVTVSRSDSTGMDGAVSTNGPAELPGPSGISSQVRCRPARGRFTARAESGSLCTVQRTLLSSWNAD